MSVVLVQLPDSVKRGPLTARSLQAVWPAKRTSSSRRHSYAAELIGGARARRHHALTRSALSPSSLHQPSCPSALGADRTDDLGQEAEGGRDHQRPSRLPDHGAKCLGRTRKPCPVIMRTLEEIDVWLSASTPDALALQKPLSDGSLRSRSWRAAVKRMVLSLTPPDPVQAYAESPIVSSIDPHDYPQAACGLW